METLEHIRFRIEAAVAGAMLEIIPNDSPGEFPVPQFGQHDRQPPKNWEVRQPPAGERVA